MRGIDESDCCFGLLVGLHVDPAAISALPPDQPNDERASDRTARCQCVVQLPIIRVGGWGLLERLLHH
jgi:hypothetical protein